MIQHQQASAQIYQFPVGGRAGRRDLAAIKQTLFAETAVPRQAAIQTSESWYHAEAINAEAKDRKST